MRKLSDYLGRLQKCANLSVLEGPLLEFSGGAPNHLGTALFREAVFWSIRFVNLFSSTRFSSFHFLGFLSSLELNLNFAKTCY